MIWVVVPAAGSGRRMAAGRPKQYLPLAGARVIDWTLERLASHPAIAGIMLVLAAEDARWQGRQRVADKPLLQAVGGAERSDSVLAGLEGLPSSVASDDWVMVHDAARPLLRHADLDALLAALPGSDGALLGIPIRDTVKRVDGAGRVVATEPRELLWRACTPQVFRRGELQRALLEARRARSRVTDEAMAVEALGLKPRLVECHEDNLKITMPGDLARAEALLALQRAR